MMQTSNTKRITALLKGTRLGHLLDRVSKLNQLEQHLNTVVPTHLQRQFKVAHVNETELTLHVTNSALATSLRYCIPTMLNVMNQHPDTSSITSIQCKVRPTSPEKQKNKERPKISSFAKNIIRSTAQIIQDKTLKQKLEQLSEDREEITN